MKVLDQVSLKGLNSFGLDVSARRLLTLETEEDLRSVHELDPRQDIVLGGGSNMLFESNVPGTVFLNRITGRDIIEERESQALVKAGGGENWHHLVRWSLAQGLSGLENLSLIPGLAGAAPVQNIGAYGVELSSVLESVTAWDWEKSDWVKFKRAECQLSYRDSRFKSQEAGRYLITSLRLLLNRQFTPQLQYDGLAAELQRQGIERPSATQVSDAVISIRRQKLPDPELTGNAGSFFKNPLVDSDQAEKLRQRFPDLPAWPADRGRYKLSAAWMIEKCDLKGFRVGDAAVSPKHSLVLINCGSASGQDISDLAQIVRTRVYEAYGTNLEQEPVSIRF